VANTFADTVFFGNSGAEAMECAIKVARKYHAANGQPERFRIITFEGAFHGRTLATLAAGGQKKYLEGFGPVVEGFDQIAFGDLKLVEAAIGPQTAGVLIEPVQGEGGIRPVPPEFMRGLRALCDKHGLLLVLDEIQCGMGRTGSLWAYQQTDVVPDAITSAKALGGGLPIGALITGERLADVFELGDHGSTFAGGPVAASAALVALDICSDPELLERVRELGAHLIARLESLPYAAAVRGRGLMVALDIEPDSNGGAPELARRALLEERLVVNATGPATIRLEPPLIVSAEEINEAVDRLGSLAP
jgi:acetylornithine/N-succinyldiaminopimelate aminotransferase